MIRNNIYRVVILSLALLFILPACSEWLSLEPENDLIEDEFWAKTEDVEGVMAAMYDAFRGTALESLIWGELRGDMMDLSGSVFDDYIRIAQSDISTNNSKIKWSGYYKTINLANTLMHFSEEVMDKDKTFTPELKQQIEAEALFLRSLSYFYLVRLWKDVPLVLSPSVSDTVDMFIPKSSEYEILNHIIEDLNTAKEMAVTTKFKDEPSFYKGRANKFSILALMADIYLWQENYQKCVETCNAIINTGLFDLESYNEWFYLYYPGNSMKESIFEIQYSSIYDNQENPIYDNLLSLTGSSKFTSSDRMGELFSVNDVRKCSTTPMVSVEKKYIGKDLKSNRFVTEKDVNFIYYRYAEILLMKAESLVELGQVVEANEILRKLAQRAGATFEGLVDQNDLRDYVLEERAREFAAEGKRWFDILRYSKRDGFKRKQFIINMVLGNAGVKERPILQTRVYDTMSYYLPIPEDELIYNQELVQNPFYDR